MRNNTHTRKNVDTPRSAPVIDSSPLDVDKPPMPKKVKETPIQGDPLNTGDSFAGLGIMPERSG